jgi:DNA-binding CsgD family transcriptional regulator
VLDRVLIGVGVVDPGLRVLYANAAARSACRNSKTMQMDHGGLRIRDAACHAELARSAGAASRGSWCLVHLPDEATTLAVVPLPASAGLVMPRPVLVVFGVRQNTRMFAIEFFAHSQGMTLTETRVLRALAEGLSPRQIASRHSVALSTIRSQIASIRSRAGAQSVVALIRTLGELPPIMAAAVD